MTAIKNHKRDEVKNLYSITGSDGTKSSYGGARVVYKQNYIEGSTTYRDVLPNVSIREDFTRHDYTNYRPESFIPQDYHDARVLCDRTYYHNGLIYNVINLMSDYVCKGIDLVHPIPKVQRFVRDWFRIVDGNGRSERFVNLLCRGVGVFVNRRTAKLNPANLEKLSMVIGSDQMSPEFLKSKPNIIPWQYKFINPATVFCDDDEEQLYQTGTFSYYVKRDKRKLGSKKENIPLDPTKVRNFFYKKDDWEPFSYPIIYPIMSNVQMLDKLRLADLAALDGAISHIRLWKLGNLEYKVIPKQAAFDRLADMLINNVGGGSIDLIWGPDIELKETSTDISKFLGQEKYVPHVNAVYEGLGIPQTLTGAGGGLGSNFISLKTLLERLEYLRSILVDFWVYELKLLQAGLGLKVAPYLSFDHMSLLDEAAEKALLIQLADRNIISYEAVQERFGEIPELEELRLNKEQKLRDKGALPRKAGPWNNPEHHESLEKIALQAKLVTPEDVGVKSSLNTKEVLGIGKFAKPTAGPGIPAPNAGVPSQGRPINSKDGSKRPQKTIKPQSGKAYAYSMVAAKQLQDKIADVINPIYLETVGKKNIRSLTNEEGKDLEQFKFSILCNLDIDDSSEDKILAVLDNELSFPSSIQELCSVTVDKFRSKFDREPNLEEMRSIQCAVYTLSIIDTTGDNDG